MGDKVKNKIIWQYSNDPFDPDNEYVDEDAVPALIGEDEDGDHSNEGNRARPIMPTPAGFVVLQVYGNMHRAFDLWIGHTNFNVSKKIVKTIEEFPGVETFTPLSRYRFQVGIGYAFNSAAVRRGIEDILLATPILAGEENPFNYVLTDEMRSRVDAIKGATNPNVPYWAMIVLPNGQVDFVRGRDEEVVTSRLAIYRATQKTVGGVIFSNVHD